MGRVRISRLNTHDDLCMLAPGCQVALLNKPDRVRSLEARGICIYKKTVNPSGVSQRRTARVLFGLGARLAGLVHNPPRNAPSSRVFETDGVLKQFGQTGRTE